MFQALFKFCFVQNRITEKAAGCHSAGEVSLVQIRVCRTGL